jgi:hypothetical protein
MNSVRTQALRALPITDLADYLLGAWHLSREIIDHGRYQLRLEGTAEVKRCADGALSYVEHATLTTEATSLEFTRAYLYFATGPGTASVEFSDGSPFYDLDLRSGGCRVRHLCDQDLYLGLILTTSNGWYTRWRCRGPGKEYVATTYLSPRGGESPTNSIA